MPRQLATSVVACVCALAAGAGASRASAQDLDQISQEVGRIESDTHNLVAQPVHRENLQSATHVEERLTDGELFYRLRDYVRASIIFTDIVDNYPTHPAFPDALFLLSDSLFKARDYLGARTRFRQLLDHSDDPHFRPYIQRTLGRLIDIAIQTRNYDGVEDYFNRLSRLPPTEVAAATQYLRAKYLYNRAVPADDVLRATQSMTSPPGSVANPPTASGGGTTLDGGVAGGGTGGGATTPPPTPTMAGVAAAGGVTIDMDMLDQARQGFEAVQERSEYYPQARYFVGVIYTLKGQYPQAIEAFRRVLTAQITTADQQHVVDLTHLALGRLYYETDQLDQAVEAYTDVQRTSSVFDVALYEIAWVHIRQGDSTRAERDLEVLTVAAPDSRFIPDGKVLRGNLLLRNGRFQDANDVFRDVARQFGPVRDQLDAMIAQHSDPRAFFEQLVRDNMDNFDANAFLPPLATRWAREEGDMDRALTVLSDLSECRQLVRETSDLIDQIHARLSSPARINGFPDLLSQRQTSIALRNRVRREMQAILDYEAQHSGGGSAELQDVRSQRRRIEETLGGAPTSDADFAMRNDRVIAELDRLNGELADASVEVMGVEARITAMRTFLQHTSAQRDAAGLAALNTELATHEAAVQSYRDMIESLRHDIQLARVRVGVGDWRYQRDDQQRSEYNTLVQRERQLLSESGQSNAQSDQLYDRLVRVQAQLDAKDQEIERVVDERVAADQRILDEETTNVAGYRTQLASLEGETVQVVGEVTYANFRAVRERFYDLVLRADVGRIDVAWAKREEHRMRVEMLTRDRSRDIQALDDEFRDIMDQSSGTPAGSTGDSGGGGGQ